MGGTLSTKLLAAAVFMFGWQQANAACFYPAHVDLARQLPRSDSIATYVRKNIRELTRVAVDRCLDEESDLKPSDQAVEAALPQNPALEEIFSVAQVTGHDGWRLLLALVSIYSDEAEEFIAKNRIEHAAKKPIIGLRKKHPTCIEPKARLVARRLIGDPDIRAAFKPKSATAAKPDLELLCRQLKVWEPKKLSDVPPDPIIQRIWWNTQEEGAGYAAVIAALVGLAR